MGKRYLVVVAFALVLLVLGFTLWRHGAPKRQAVKILIQLHGTLMAGQPDLVLNMLHIPPAFQGRTRAEQSDFAIKALTDEVSPEGIQRLVNNGQFGPLLLIFPTEGAQWAAQSGVEASNCVAFVSTEGDPRAEVVFLVETGNWRVVRLNNVK